MEKKVRNRAPAQFQITAEQLLRDAEDYKDLKFKAPVQHITSQAELDDYRLSKRKEFEDQLLRGHHKITLWLKYAEWEAKQYQFERARSVFERALDVNHRLPRLWIRYAEMEMTNKFVNHARNVWKRATDILPRVDQLWYKWLHMEQLLGNMKGARGIFTRWMKLEPDINAYYAFAKFELRQSRIDNARQVMEAACTVHNRLPTYLRYAKMEMRQVDGSAERARLIYTRALGQIIQATDSQGRAVGELEVEHANHPSLYLAFAQFETQQGELARARQLYRLALDTLPGQEVDAVFRRYAAFEKQHGDADDIEQVVWRKRRTEYEQELSGGEDPQQAGARFQYDVWFDYCRLEEDIARTEYLRRAESENSDPETLDRSCFARAREVFERAVGNVPLSREPGPWSRYMYLWLQYAMFEELVARNNARAETVYRTALRVLPHDSDLSFPQMWVWAAKFLVRAGDGEQGLSQARSLLGQALGRCADDALYRDYIALEMRVGALDRVRKLYRKWVQFSPARVDTWIAWAQLERDAGELQRAREVFSVAVDMHREGKPLDNPLRLYHTFIRTEVEAGQFTRVRQLYDQLVHAQPQLKVWVSYAQFEAGIRAFPQCRQVFQRADQWYRDELTRASSESKQAQDPVARSRLGADRAMLLRAWREFEGRFGTSEQQGAVPGAPRLLPGRKQLYNFDGSPGGWEEYTEYVFPDLGAEKWAGVLKLKEEAKKWKQRMMADSSSSEDGSGSSSSSSSGSGSSSGDSSSSSSDDSSSSSGSSGSGSSSSDSGSDS